MTPLRPVLSSFLLVLALMLPGCGGSDKSAAEPTSTETSREPEVAEEPEDVMIPAEKFDELQNFFDRKRKVITRCFTAAIDAGEASKRGGGRVAVTMVIARSGKLGDIKITELIPESETLKTCTLKQVRSWTVTDLPKDLDYSYTFAFGTL